MEFHQFTLNNGLRVIHQQTSGPASHCGFIVNSGTRDEKGHQFGIAHFIEHCLFKGTQKRKAFHILSRLDAVGGEINAYTSKENTVLHASFLDKHYDRAIELLSDIIINSTFPEREIVKEKLIIIDEIYSYLDSPSEQIFDDFEDIIYANHSLGHNILGTSEQLKKYKKEHLLDFYKEHYVVSNMVFASVGNIAPKKLEKLLNKYTEQIPNHTHHSDRKEFKDYSVQHVVQEKEAHQAHYLLGNLSFSYKDVRRRPMILLNNILGGPAMNSRLNLNISEKYGFAYNLESNYTTYCDTGYFNIYLGTERKSLERAKGLILKEMKKLCDKKLGTTQLHMAKQQILGQIALGQESGSSQMLALGKSLLSFDKVDTLEEIYEQIESITAEQLIEIANLVFDQEKLSSLTYLPA